MKKVLHVILFSILFSCNGAEEKAHVEAQEQSIKHFDNFIFSIEPGWSTENGRDVEINKGGTAYLRLRDNWIVKENYKVNLDLQSLRKIAALIDSMNIESLDSLYQEYEDGAYYSMRLTNNSREVRTKGMNYPSEVQKMILEVVQIVEGQPWVKTSNKRFVTTKDVLKPLPPGHMEAQVDLNSL
ncbi:hypothetical protein [uncultured Pontibacter sp.]|uniref:hypothetical protein n=1 Tax=uncultured Pontibacter sp. TaxID=453356 RepID=UPI0026399877|nr:hypothetical protein [uncultured Pontibacter sp.]